MVLTQLLINPCFSYSIFISGHPERPETVGQREPERQLFACHGDFGLLERCYRLQSREATEDELLLVHAEDHIRKMKGTQIMSNRDLHRFKENFNSIFFNNNSYQCALVSAGSILQVCQAETFIGLFILPN